MQTSLLTHARIIQHHLNVLRDHRTALTSDQAESVNMMYEQSHELLTKLHDWATTGTDHALYRHDVRNMLTPLMGFAQLMVNGQLGKVDDGLVMQMEMLNISIRLLRTQIDLQSKAQSA